jgi:hypothetical protein
MGLDTPAGVLLAAAKSIGADFSDVMMVGRQYFQIRPRVLARIFAEFDIAENAAEFRDRHEYAERFLELMGAARVDSVDFSDYEGATHQHDFNQPLPAGLHEKYSLVLDSGTLEHVFNIAQALKNCMQMVRVGGHFVQVNCANNYARTWLLAVLSGNALPRPLAGKWVRRAGDDAARGEEGRAVGDRDRPACGPGARALRKQRADLHSDDRTEGQRRADLLTVSAAE